MYVERSQLINYGPIEHRGHRQVPFDGRPNPCVHHWGFRFGKSVRWSHIANGLILAHELHFLSTPDLEPGQVFKLRSWLYNRLVQRLLFWEVDGVRRRHFVGEMRIRSEQGEPPSHIHEACCAGRLAGCPSEQRLPIGPVKDLQQTNSRSECRSDSMCALLSSKSASKNLPWLNEPKICPPRPQTWIKHTSGHTSRRVLTYSPECAISKWLFEVVYDRVSSCKQRERTFRSSKDPTELRCRFPILGLPRTVNGTYQLSLELYDALSDPGNVRFGIRTTA